MSAHRDLISDSNPVLAPHIAAARGLSRRSLLPPKQLPKSFIYLGKLIHIIGLLILIHAGFNAFTILHQSSFIDPAIVESFSSEIKTPSLPGYLIKQVYAGIIISVAALSIISGPVSSAVPKSNQSQDSLIFGRSGFKSIGLPRGKLLVD